MVPSVVIAHKRSSLFGARFNFVTFSDGPKEKDSDGENEVEKKEKKECKEKTVATKKENCRGEQYIDSYRLSFDWAVGLNPTYWTFIHNDMYLFSLLIQLPIILTIKSLVYEISKKMWKLWLEFPFDQSDSLRLLPTVPLSIGRRDRIKTTGFLLQKGIEYQNS